MNIQKKMAARIAMTALALTLLTTTALADGISESEIGVGVKNLFTDLTTYIMVLSPIVGGAAAGYFLIRRGMADEQDGKMWMKRAVTAVICAVAGLVVGAIIRLISSYF